MVNPAPANPRSTAPESPTRDRVLRVISERGPITMAALVADLGLTETAVRRHVEHLVSRGLLQTRDAGGPRKRRGRPARAWVVSPRGHRALSSDYDHLAGEALRFLSETAGRDAVAAFAERRIAEAEERYTALADAAGPDSADRALALVDALTADGYAASARPVGEPGSASPLTGIQLCQGHCPVQHVAAEFPQFCDAETEAFSRILGVHVQRLATLAQGDHVCTTFVPTAPTARKVTP